MTKTVRPYQKISDHTRNHLISLIIQGLSIKKAAENLNINYENAKAIHRVFTKQKRVNKCQKRKRKPNVN